MANLCNSGLRILIFLFFIISTQIVKAEGFGGVTNYYIIPYSGLQCDPSSIYISSIYDGDSTSRNISVWEGNISYTDTYYANFSASSGAPGSWASFNPVNVLVPPGNNPSPTNKNSTIITISVPSGTSAGTHIGYTFANSSRGNCTIPLTVVVQPRPPVAPPTGAAGGGGGWITTVALDTRVVVETGYELVTPGSRVYATITVQKISGPSGVINVNLTYQIKDPSGNVIDKKTTVVGVETTRSDIYYLTIPTDARIGIWTFEVEGRYDTSVDTSSTTFQVVLKAGEISIIEYSDVIIVKQGEIKYETVVVENIGYALLKDARLVVQGIPTKWYTVDPEKIDIPAGGNQTFIIKFKIPEDADLKDYPITFKVISGILTNDVNSILKVREKVFEIIKVVDIETPMFIVGERNNIEITLRNEGPRALPVTVTLTLPKNFLIDKNSITKTVYPNTEEIYKFSALSEKTGTFVIKMNVTYEGGEIAQDIPVNVYMPKILKYFLWGILTFVAILIIVVLIVYYIIHLRRKRREFYQKVKLTQIKSIVKKRKR